jgi:type IV pilus assembly protein PilQ
MIESRIVIANNDFARDLGVRFGLSTSMGATGGNELMVAGGRPGHLPGSYDINKGPFMNEWDPANGKPAPNPQPTYSGLPFNTGIDNPAGSGSEALLVNLPAPTPSGAVNFLIGKVGSYLLQLELSAMQREGRGEIVSSPRVITSDSHKATIKVGQEIPFQESSASGRTTVAFKEAVLQLDVTPQITPDDRIIMDLKVSKDSVGQIFAGVPSIDTRNVSTRVLVDNGETLVLGGIYEQERGKEVERVPFFGELPGVGWLFKTERNRNDKSEMLIFVTPKIIKQSLALQ